MGRYGEVVDDEVEALEQLEAGDDDDDDDRRGGPAVRVP